MRPDCTYFDTVPQCILSNKPAKCEVDQISGSGDMQNTDRQTDRETWLYS